MKKTLMSLVRDTAMIYGAQMLGVAVGLGLSILVARTLGPDGRGAYAWIMTMHFLAAQLGLLGADTMYRRLGATRPELASTLAGNSGVQALAGGAVAGVLMLCFALMQPIGATHKMGLVFGMAALPAALATTLFASLALARGHAKLMAMTEITQRLLLVGLVGSAYFITGYLTLNLLMAGVALAMWLTAALAVWKVRGLIRPPWKFEAGLWWRERYLLLGALGNGLASFGVQKLDLIMLGAWRPLAESGFYAVAQALMDASLILPGALGYVLVSRIAGLETQQERRSMLLRVVGMMVGGFAVIAVVASAVGGWIIPLLFGAPFVESVPVFSVLMVAAVAGAAYTVAQNAAIGIGRVRYVMAGPLAGVAVKLAAGAALIPAYGMMGAAWGNAAAYATAAAVAFGVAWGRKIKLPSIG